jgi:hypothetical protein
MSYADLKESLHQKALLFQPNDEKTWFSCFLNDQRVQVSVHADLKAEVVNATMFLVRSRERISKAGNAFTEYLLCKPKVKEGSFTA